MLTRFGDDAYRGSMVSAGLEGVVAAQTRLSDVDGERGELVIAGFRLDELAGRATFEETTWLLWHGDLPNAVELAAFRQAIAGARELPVATLALLNECAARRVEPMDALRMAVATFSLAPGVDAASDDSAAGIVARVPTAIAAYWRLRR